MKHADEKELAVAKQRIAVLEQQVSDLQLQLDDCFKELATFKAVADNAADAINIADTEGVFIYANRVCYEMFGGDYEKKDIVGRTIMDFWTEDQLDKLQNEIFPQVMTEGSWRGEMPVKRLDGTFFYSFLTAFLLKNQEGDSIGMAAIIRDITKQKRMIEERERLQSKLIEAQQQTIKELSVPIIPVMEQVIVLPLVGNIDQVRAQILMRTLLSGISNYRAKIVIIDITGVTTIDSDVAAYIDKAIQAARLKGARTILTGISDAVAETVIDLGIDWSNLETLRDLQTGLITALHKLNLQISIN